ncbi:MAG: iron ABC transporter permease [Pseudomonadota bacterium]
MTATAEQETGRLAHLGGSRTALLFFVLLTIASMALIAELALGPVQITPDRVLATLTGGGEPMESAILWQIRIPRAALGIAVGVSMALSGAALQGLLRNPLAEPGLIGVTAGASLGAVMAIVLGGLVVGLMPDVIAPFLLPIAAFIGGATVIAILFSLVRFGSGPSVATLILAGVAINAIVGAAIGVLIYISDDQQLRDLTFWTMGSLGVADTRLIGIVTVLALLTFPVFLGSTRALDLLQLGERAAFYSGLNINRARMRIAAATALSVGAVTCAAGPIGFIGLVAPHIARMMFGPGHKVLLPASALIGVILVLAADLGVRLAVPPAEPPIGLATSLIGGPFFLWLLMRQVSRGRVIA